MEEGLRAQMVVSGRVQGVFFRQTTFKKAKALGVFGWVRNLNDGRVEALFEGEREKVKEMVNWFKHGPDSAKVYNFEVEWQEYKKEFKGFKIKY